MRVVASDYAVAGVLLQIYDASADGFASDIHSFTIETLRDRISSNLSPNFDTERTNKVVKVIVSLGLGSFFEDPFADEIFQISDSQIRTFFSSRSGANDIYARSWNLGLEWIVSAYAKDAFWSEFDKEDIDMIFLLPPPPDDQFPHDHNSKSIEDAGKAFDDVIAALDKANDLGSLTSEDAETAQRELIALRDELVGENPQFPSIVSRARGVLSWIAKEAASAAVGALAIAAYFALMKVIGA